MNASAMQVQMSTKILQNTGKKHCTFFCKVMSKKDCFNVDETGVLYKLLPAKPSAQNGNYDMVAEVSKNATLQLQWQ